jgi:hypothetical protein
VLEVIENTGQVRGWVLGTKFTTGWSRRHDLGCGARSDVKRQIPAAAASSNDDALLIDERKLAQVFDHSDCVVHRHGGLEVDVTTAVGWRNEDVTCCQ